MHRSIRSRFGTTSVIAGLGITALVAMPIAPSVPAQPFAPVPQAVRLAASEVPPGGLIASFLNNQAVYCSIICPLLVDTGTTALTTTLQTPSTFINALGSGDVWKAIGITAASVTGPTNAAAAAAILADGSLVAPRAQNAFEVAVIGAMNVAAAAQGGLPGILDAIQAFRQNTYDALNAPIVANPTSTVVPHGVVQIAVVGAMNVVGAIIFPAFNDVLGAVFEVPDAVAQELAASGDPVRAVAAGLSSAAAAANAAVTVVRDAIDKAVIDLRAATGSIQPSSATTILARDARSNRLDGPATKLRADSPAVSHSLPDSVSKAGHAVRDGVSLRSRSALRATVPHALDH